ncbi:LRR receptor-like serine/threonine-protein kinase ERECTA [Miscanthus floridulus]|uniref:LRR receptor-like serine/threonine-protein kinase ERECTA n=1 Tax=Miscanthus floridulus TaxID=154761 RepID=UPI0034579AA7
MNVPKLVFEFVPNGSLCDLLLGVRHRQELPLPARLRIAIGAAEALSYMHSHGHHNYIHGDVKSANILLDNDLTPKTGRFTEKSDVYSFGVVLLELTTRKTVKYDESNSLPIDFVKCCKEEGNGRAMYDREILMAHHAQECLDKIGALAVQCLKTWMRDRLWHKC